MKRSVGNWVVGDRFWDREQDLELFIQRIDEGQHILLVAQRRIGKTSLMKEAGQRLQDRYLCVFADLQKAKSAEDVIVELSLATHPHKPLWRKISGVFANILGKMVEAVDEVNLSEFGVKIRGGLTAGNWAEKGDQLFQILATSEKPVLMLLDEVPILVNRILKPNGNKFTEESRSNADLFMSWLRQNSIKHQGNIRMVLTGSIGFEPVLNQAKLSSTLNTFAPFELKPWDESTAVGCLMALAEEYGLDAGEDILLEMVRRLGCCIPHHVQLFFSHIFEFCRRRNDYLLKFADVETVYATEMLSVRGHAELSHYEERLKLVLGEAYFPLALEMLTEAAVTGKLDRDSLKLLKKYYQFDGQTVEEAERQILQVLEHDGYLERSRNEYVFVSRLIRDWWKNRYDAFYTPLQAREG